MNCNTKEKFDEFVLEHFVDARKQGDGYQARCPAHHDVNPSLSINIGDDGRILLHCHAGCKIDVICEAIGVKKADLFSLNHSSRKNDVEEESSTPSPTFQTWREALAEYEGQFGPVTMTYDYHDLDGILVGVICRWDKNSRKTIRPIALIDGSWQLKQMPAPRPLYRLQNLHKAEEIVIVEGEKCVEAAESIGLVATTSAGGANASHQADWSSVAGKNCVILPDNDKAGREHAQRVAGELLSLIPPANVKIVELPDLRDGEDIADWLSSYRCEVDPDAVRQELKDLIDVADSIQISSLPESKVIRNEFTPILASQLGGGETFDWLWVGWLARSYVTLLIGLWKAGKSTLLSHILCAAEKGGHIAGKIYPAKILVITEEGAGLWARRRDEVGISDNVSFIIRPFKGRPTNAQWRAFVNAMAARVNRDGIAVVVFDTWQSVSPVDNENDSAAMMSALLPLHTLTAVGAAVLIIHHPRKGDAGEGQASRGSGALPGFVDTIIELRRYDPERSDDRRRKLKGLSRFDETPKEVVIELTEKEGYRTIGEVSDVKQADQMVELDELLSDDEWKMADEVLAEWPEPKPGKATVRRLLKNGFESDRYYRRGDGKKGSPYQFKIRFKSGHTLGADVI
ncbi:MAG: AAA family ATPase [Planctomycetota bacterium]|nr:AAA family ATPase [Planctomycetota bacterium]MDA1214960.1 AAA family ATPase [Planctomycetota bacterium]